jgi:4-amino-4-deoxy-L-arabinose transferase-like glycosyltransferase
VRTIRVASQLPFALLAAASLLIFLGGLGRLPLFGRDESLYAEAAREMCASGDWLTPTVNGGPFFEKPPLLYWMSAASFRLFGVSAFAARLPVALTAVLTVLLTAALGARVWNRRAGLLAGLALATSLQMATIGRMGIMDVPLTCLTLLALLCYAQWRISGKLAFAPLFGLSIGLGVLLKALAGGIPMLVAAVHYTLYRGAPRRLWLAPALLACACCLVVAAPWFVAMWARGGEVYRSTLFLHEHLRRILHPMQGHGGPVLYYAALIAITFFPWVAFLPAAVRPRNAGADDRSRLWYSLAVVWIIAVLVPFSLISTKLPGYVTPLFPAMALLVGAELDRRLPRGASSQLAAGRAPWLAVILGSCILAAGVALLPRAAEHYAPRAGAEAALPLLRGPVLSWMIAYLVIGLGALLALQRRPALGLAAAMAGQLVAVGAVLLGLFPVISPCLEGGREWRLAELAGPRIRGHQLALYDTRPEAIAFHFQHPVLAFGRGQEAQLLGRLRGRWTVLIAPTKDRALWESLGGRLAGTVGDHAVADIRNGPWPEPAPSDMLPLPRTRVPPPHRR